MREGLKNHEEHIATKICAIGGPVCLHCRRPVAYKEVVTPVTFDIRGLQVTYKESSAHCMNCGNEIYVGRINDENVSRRIQAYFNAMRGV